MKNTFVGVAMIIGLALLLGPARPATAADPGTVDELVIDGSVDHVLRLGSTELKAIPATVVDVSYATGHGEETGHFSGTLLWTLIERAGIAGDGAKPKHHLGHSLLVTGRDGYAVTLSVGELDPDFEGKSVILAYARDDKPTPPAEGLRLVVPGDKKGGRSVRDVVRIEVK